MAQVLHYDVSETERQSTAEELATDVAVPNLREKAFQHALPQLVFEKVFTYLSPGYLWIFGRVVCKAWKELIEFTIPRLTFEKALIQILMYREHNESLESITDENYRVHSATYRCTRYTPGNIGNELNGVFTFTPCKNCTPYEHSSNSIGAMYGWRILDIVSSVFPARWKDNPALWHKNNGMEGRNMNGVVNFYGGFIQRKDCLTQCDIDAFHARPATTKPKQPKMMPLSSAQRTHCTFDTPEEYLDIVVKPYTMKCRYLTTLTLRPNPYPTGPNWDERGTLVIDQVEISLPDLLNWRCGCPDKRPCPVQNLLVRPRHENDRAPRGCVYPIDHPSYRHAFPYFPCADRNKSKSRVSSLGEPAIAAFIRVPADLQSIWPKKSPTTRLPCRGCIEGMEDGSLSEERKKLKVRAASNRCHDKLCGQCCAQEGCKEHRKRPVQRAKPGA